jgi:hypothetical protein
MPVGLFVGLKPHANPIKAETQSFSAACKADVEAAAIMRD